MRITESQLRRIINRTVKTMINEGRRPARRGGLVDLIFEDADPSKIDLSRFPKALSDAAKDAKMADKVTKGIEDNATDDDTVKVEQKDDLPVAKLMPSQSTMRLDNAIGMAMGMLSTGKVGGDLGAFVSKDMFIMDGHHRWIATYMVDPGGVVGGKLVNLPGDKLVAVLNALTAAKFNKKGKPGQGSFEDFKNKDMMIDEINKIVEKGVPKFEGEPPKQVGYFTTPEEAKKVVDDKGGADKLADMFIKNLASATLKFPEWGVPRKEMPVIDGGDRKTSVDALTGGEIDLNPPYYEEGGGKKPENAGRVRGGDVMFERWQRLAGLIK